MVAICLAAGLLVACGGEAEEETTETTAFVDVEAPQIIGIRDYTVPVGHKVDFLAGIDVTDNADPTPKLSVNNNGVFLGYPGVYTAIYTAWDDSGNVASSYATITVLDNG